MSELLNISRATFFRKIKTITIDTENYGKHECEFCLRMKENDIPPSPSVTVITNEMKEYLNTACDGHKDADMARILGVKPNTLTIYLSRHKEIDFSNKDPEK